jgi:hypothetical protein
MSKQVRINNYLLNVSSSKTGVHLCSNLESCIFELPECSESVIITDLESYRSYVIIGLSDARVVVYQFLCNEEVVFSKIQEFRPWPDLDGQISILYDDGSFSIRMNELITSRWPEEIMTCDEGDFPDIIGIKMPLL